MAIPRRGLRAVVAAHLALILRCTSQPSLQSIPPTEQLSSGTDHDQEVEGPEQDGSDDFCGVAMDVSDSEPEFDLPSGQGHYLEPCIVGVSDTESCWEGYCMPTRYSNVCVWDVGWGQCPSDFKAIPIGSYDPWYGCVSMLAAYGQPCTDFSDCVIQTPYGPTGYLWDCAWSGGSPAFRQCTSRCFGNTAPCPNVDTTCGFDRAGTEAEGPFCLASMPLACPRSAFLQGSEGPCTRTNTHGTCPGKATCAGYGPHTSPTCDAPEPTTETCAPNGKGDNIDQDCDGQTDEGCAP